MTNSTVVPASVPAVGLDSRVSVRRTVGRGPDRKTIDALGIVVALDGSRASVTLDGETDARNYALTSLTPSDVPAPAPAETPPAPAPATNGPAPRLPRSEQMTKAEHRTYVIATLVDRFGADVPKERSDLLSAIHEVGDVAYNEGAVFHHTIERFGNGKWLSPTALSDIARKLRKAAKDAS